MMHLHVTGARFSQSERPLHVTDAYATHVEFRWVASDPEVVKLRVIATNPRFLGPAIDTFVGFDVIDRTVEVRVEQFK